MKCTNTNHSVSAWIVSAMFITITLLSCTDASEGKKQISNDTMSIKEVQQETQDLIKALGTYTVDQRDEAIERTKTALDKMDKRIDALETRIDTNREQMNEDARENARAALKALGEQRTEAASWYSKLKTSSGDAWENTKKGLSNAYRNLSDAWGNFEKELADNK